VFLTTAFPTFRLIAYATSTAIRSEGSATKLIRNGPLWPRPVGDAKSANCRRVRTRPGTAIRPSTGDGPCYDEP
jgi:hypothetical protein